VNCVFNFCSLWGRTAPIPSNRLLRRTTVRLSGRRCDLLFLIKGNEKQISLPRLQNRDDMFGGFSATRLRSHHV